MPSAVQDFWRFDASTRHTTKADYRALARQALVLICAALVAAFLVSKLNGALWTGNYGALKVVLLIFFAVNIFWLSLAACVALLGFAAIIIGVRTPLRGMNAPFTGPLKTRIAILMPIFSEPAERVFGAAIAMLRAIACEGAQKNFDYFVLSDTIDAKARACEQRSFRLAREQLGEDQKLYYRHRSPNTGKKAGNIAEWCARWGASYDYMIMLDADSLMSGKALISLARLMEQNPDAAVIQSCCHLINRKTLFGRWMQFENRVFGYWSAAVARGTSFWHRGSSSFWGHNAIVRVRAFTENAILPSLPGRPPFGGHILSHDILEAAMMSRAGWKLWLAPEIKESYEEAPATIMDWAKREYRWCQGGIQHLRILGAHGFSWFSRLHLSFFSMFGATSAIWVLFLAAFIILSLGLHSLHASASLPSSQFFPDYVFRNRAQAVQILIFTAVLFSVPKWLGYFLILFDRQSLASFGGPFRLAASAIFEFVFSLFFSQVKIILRFSAYLHVLFGEDRGWPPSRRDDLPRSNIEFFRFHLMHTIIGGALLVLIITTSAPMVIWLAPSALCLFLSCPLSILAARQYKEPISKLLQIPEEVAPPAIAVETSRYECLIESNLALGEKAEAPAGSLSEV